jgi:SsrA-binding protein
MPAEKTEKPEKESIARNKRARHDYQILDTWEAGIVLTGSEVKSLRNGKANISDAYGIVKEGEVHLLNLHIRRTSKRATSITSPRELASSCFTSARSGK